MKKLQRNPYKLLFINKKIEKNCEKYLKCKKGCGIVNVSKRKKGGNCYEKLKTCSWLFLLFLLLFLSHEEKVGFAAEKSFE